ncbi:hypothetical protein GQ54DRAFT_198081 [Martensiomyces pterosporus]|nr:hypothetical protein GQ54DRAFT_198081 [Martensiomyces pterosporus]
MALSADDIKLRDALKARLAAKAEVDYFGKDLPVNITAVRASDPSFAVSVLVTEDETSISGTLDEGWVATTTDNLTSTLVTAIGGNALSVTTSLTTTLLAPIVPGTQIVIECNINGAQQPPNATAVFRDAEDPSVNYAVGTHTKFFKAELAEMARRARSARM